MNNTFKRVLALVQRTGDRMVVIDPDHEEAFVIMGIDDYEALAELEKWAIEREVEFEETEEEVEVIREIEEPTVEQAPVVSKKPSSIIDVMPSAGENASTWDLSSMTPKEREEVQVAFKEYNSKETSPTLAKKDDVPVIDLSENKTDDDFGEEQFYLEPIE